MMLNLHRAMTSGATALDLPFGGLTATPNLQYQRGKIDFVARIDYSLK